MDLTMFTLLVVHKLQIMNKKHYTKLCVPRLHYFLDLLCSV